MKFEDLTGKRFERYTALKRVENANNGCTMWLCRCDCGIEKTVLASDLKRGHRRSCGCLRREVSRLKIMLPEGESAFNALYSERRSGALKRGHTWLLDKEQFKQLVTANCHYCGATPSQKIFGEARMTAKNFNGNFVYNGVDRKDNDRGYLEENCLPCCKTCNFAKHNMSYLEFISFIERLVAFRK